MRQKLLAKLLHYANADPPGDRQAFYDIKANLLERYGTFRGHELQEIRKDCWGPWGSEYGERIGCQGDKCSRCGGTGIFDIRWVRLERWEWCGYVFHCPSGDTRTPPEVGSVKIFGRIQHADYGLASPEAALWLYLLLGEFRLWWRELRGSRYAYPRWWPMLRLQAIVAPLCWKLRRRRCWCGKRFWTWGSGWQICKRCRNEPADCEEVPF